MKKYPMLVSIMSIYDVKQKELAEAADLHRQSIRRKLNGDREFSLTEAKMIKDYINDKLERNWTIEDIFFSTPVAKQTRKTS